MTGETDLETLIAGLEPVLCETPYAIATSSTGSVPAGIDAVGTFREKEGLTVIAPLREVAGTDLVFHDSWAMISLTVHSSLSAVGLTAAVASALANAGISANMVAAYFHDHIFVPWDMRNAALEVLQRLRTRQA